jgi:hypothetical protein
MRGSSKLIDPSLVILIILFFFLKILYIYYLKFMLFFNVKNMIIGLRSVSQSIIGNKNYKALLWN